MLFFMQKVLVQLGENGFVVNHGEQIVVCFRKKLPYKLPWYSWQGRLVGIFNKRDEEIPSIFLICHRDDVFVKPSINAKLNNFCTMSFLAVDLFNPWIIFIKTTFLELLVEGGVDQCLET